MHFLFLRIQNSLAILIETEFTPNRKIGGNGWEKSEFFFDKWPILLLKSSIWL